MTEPREISPLELGRYLTQVRGQTDKAASTAVAGSVAEKIRAALAEPYRLTVTHGALVDALVEHRCTASIGVAVFIDSEGTQDDFLRLADTAMYQAKNEGSNLIRMSEAESQS